MSRKIADRMKPLAVVLPLLALGTTAADAALSPSWQSAREFTAIVEDSRVHDALKYEEPIISIRLQEPLAGNRVYVLTTPHCTLLVTVAYKMAEPGMVGPAKFDIDVGEADCK